MNCTRFTTARAATTKGFLAGAYRAKPLPRTTDRRSYATGAGAQGSAGPSKNWLKLSILLGIPVSIFLWQRLQTPNSKDHKQGEERNRSSRDYDQPRSRGEQGGTGSMSFKQEGLSNTNTSNPHVNDPGLSQKGEGETETAKVKGTVQHDRPQV
ncbi:hypothetical protein N7523_010909 [Penicillium sp. IBT 18751x]|nr:hypothetical protein N7523_010909 [Penicillium sp. IBT 18751x]